LASRFSLVAAAFGAALRASRRPQCLACDGRDIEDRFGRCICRTCGREWNPIKRFRRRRRPMIAFLLGALASFVASFVFFRRGRTYRDGFRDREHYGYGKATERHG
jgi:hypothetical protein